MGTITMHDGVLYSYEWKRIREEMPQAEVSDQAQAWFLYVDYCGPWEYVGMYPNMREVRAAIENHDRSQ